MKARRRHIIMLSGSFFLATLGTLGRRYGFIQMETESNLILYLMSFVAIFTVWEGLWYINYFVGKIYPLDTRPGKRIFIQMLLGILLMIPLRVIGYICAARYMNLEFPFMFKVATFIVDFFFVATVNLGFFSSYYFKRWKESIKRAERLEKEKTQVQFDNLKNQLNPHFLFNALTSLNSLIYSDQHLASSFLQHLSKVYRYLLLNKEVVSLQTELDFIRNYVFLVKTRFQDAVDVDIRVDDSAKDKAVVPVTLQILIENALKHNVISPNRPLRITVSTADDYLVVENNFQPKTTVETSNKQGLENLRNLYHYLSGKQIEAIETDNTFVVKIPLIEQ